MSATFFRHWSGDWTREGNEKQGYSMSLRVLWLLGSFQYLLAESFRRRVWVVWWLLSYSSGSSIKFVYSQCLNSQELIINIIRSILLSAHTAILFSISFPFLMSLSRTTYSGRNPKNLSNLSWITKRITCTESINNLWVIVQLQQRETRQHQQWTRTCWAREQTN